MKTGAPDREQGQSPFVWGLVTRESTARSVVTGSDVDQHVEQLQSYVAAGYDKVYVATMGPQYLAMIEAYGREVLPRLRS